jgi:hypothetical protein
MLAESEWLGTEAKSVNRFDVRVASVVLLGVAFWSVGISSQSAAPPPALPQGNTGIAASYPNDAGIGANPNVLFADQFDTYTSASQLTSSGRYSGYYQTQNFAIDSSTFFGGSGKSLRIRMPQSGNEISNGLVKNISPTRDSMFMRVYTRYQPNYAGSIPRTTACASPATIRGRARFPTAGISSSSTSRMHGS